ncbi:hypothetical protein DOTSEDRAFT_70694 [Dothistroma septosporum NZE10]|uniref:Uncharacterized protein n=1 Tax=Dothistroma septosporum (strain NZE10 / CBS 128990) TaxID=675120 RepID=N1PTM6_DOTSN|nr:hypothetical protein DOTSEDRAFT_70694 [Dothistroma septosporum NZE10]
MLASSLLTVAAATLATALPAGVTPAAAPGQFDITNFIFGCTAGCFWYLDIAVHPAVANHPSVPSSVHCQGNLDDNKSFKECDHVTNESKLYAFIGKDDNLLQLKYEVTNSSTSTVYNYYGEKEVYAATSAYADLQTPNFNVTEISGTKSKSS